MKTHITRIYGRSGPSYLAQKTTAESAEDMGFLEIGLYCLDISRESDSELKCRQTGSVSAVEEGDIVIIQSPSWNHNLYDDRLITRIRAFGWTKIIIMVHDVLAPLFTYGDDYMRETINFYNRADMLIVPSRRMLDFLRSKGLIVKKVKIQTIYDHPVRNALGKPAFLPNLYFNGPVQQYPFLNHWKNETPITLFNSKEPAKGANIDWRGKVSEMELLTTCAKGGFGLLWPDGIGIEGYSLMTQPYDLGTYLAAGIPVIMQRGMTGEQFVTEHGLGFVVDSLGEAGDMVRRCTRNEYYAMLAHMEYISFLVRNGYYTKKLFTDAVFELVNG